MTTEEIKNPCPDLKPFQPFGIPMLKLLGGLAVLSLLLVALYELIF